MSEKRRINKNRLFLKDKLQLNVKDIVDFLIQEEVFTDDDYTRIIQKQDPLREDVGRLITRLQPCTDEQILCFYNALKHLRLHAVIDQLESTNLSDTAPIQESGDADSFPHSRSRDELASSCSVGLRTNAEPTYLPGRNINFTGREKELTELHDTLNPLTTKGHGRHSLSWDNQELAVTGLGGVGKSQVVLEYAHQHQDDYDFVRWIRCGNNSTNKSMTKFAEDLGIQVENVEDTDIVKRIFEQLKSYKSWLLVYDYADSNIKKFMPDRGYLKQGQHVIITTQSVEGWAHHMELDVFNEQDATRYIKSRLPTNHRDAHKEIAILELAKTLGRLPLALSQAVAYIKQCLCSIADYIGTFNEITIEMMNKNIRFDNHPTKCSVFGTLFTSIKDILEKDPFLEPTYDETDDAATLLKCLAVLDSEEIPLSLFKGCKLFPGPIRFHQAVAKLREYSLISSCQRDGCIRIHKLVQHVIQDYKQHDLAEKLPEQFTRRILQPLTEVIFKSLPADCTRIGWKSVDDECLDLLKVITPHIETLLSHVNKALEEQTRLDNEEGIESDVIKDMRQCKCSLLEVAGYSGYFRRDVAAAVSGFRELNFIQAKYDKTPTLKTLQTLQMLGNCERLSRNHDDAIKRLTEAERISSSPDFQEDLEVLHLRITITAALGKAYYFKGEECVNESLTLLEKALQQQEKHFPNDDDLVSYILPKMGHVSFMLDDFATARKCFGDCLMVRQRIYHRDHILIGLCHYGLGKIQMRLNQVPESEESFKTCLDSVMHNYTDSHPYVGKVNWMMGKCYILQKKFDKARECLEQAEQNLCRNYGADSEYVKVVSDWMKHAENPDVYPFVDNQLLNKLGF